MQLVEIIRGLQNLPRTFNTVKSLTEKMGKIPVEANDFPGFISNRILMPMINEAIYTLFEGVGTPEAIDSVMKLGIESPHGPFDIGRPHRSGHLLSHHGECFIKVWGDSKISPLPSPKKYVDAGYLGRKNRKRILINIVRSSEFRVRSIIKFSEFRTKYSELSLRDYGLQAYFRARDDPGYGKGFYGEEHQTRCKSSRRGEAIPLFKTLRKWPI